MDTQTEGRIAPVTQEQEQSAPPAATPPATPADLRDQQVKADKELRVGIDSQLQALKSLSPSRERALAVTKLQEAIMWLGMDLKRLAEPNPYPNSYDASNAIVDKTADGLKL
jgi:hypothetical protein